MSLNADLIRTRCAEIEESVGRLERFGAMPREAVLADQDALDVVCYRLLVAIEASFALCYHVSAQRLRRVPEDYAGCFGLLAEAKLIPPDLANRLQDMARFRNLLVHMYWKVDYGQVFEVVARDLGDLRGFAAAMAGLL